MDPKTPPADIVPLPTPIQSGSIVSGTQLSGAQVIDTSNLRHTSTTFSRKELDDPSPSPMVDRAAGTQPLTPDGRDEHVLAAIPDEALKEEYLSDSSVSDSAHSSPQQNLRTNGSSRAFENKKQVNPPFEYDAALNVTRNLNAGSSLPLHGGRKLAKKRPHPIEKVLLEIGSISSEQIRNMGLSALCQNLTVAVKAVNALTTANDKYEELLTYEELQNSLLSIQNFESAQRAEVQANITQREVDRLRLENNGGHNESAAIYRRRLRKAKLRLRDAEKACGEKDVEIERLKKRIRDGRNIREAMEAAASAAQVHHQQAMAVAYHHHYSQYQAQMQAHMQQMANYGGPTAYRPPQYQQHPFAQASPYSEHYSQHPGSMQMSAQPILPQHNQTQQASPQPLLPPLQAPSHSHQPPLPSHDGDSTKSAGTEKTGDPASSPAVAFPLQNSSVEVIQSSPVHNEAARTLQASPASQPLQQIPTTPTNRTIAHLNSPSHSTTKSSPAKDRNGLAALGMLASQVLIHQRSSNNSPISETSNGLGTDERPSEGLLSPVKLHEAPVLSPEKRRRESSASTITVDSADDHKTEDEADQESDQQIESKLRFQPTASNTSSPKKIVKLED